MSAVGEQLYQAGIRCDHAGCIVSIWRVERSRELAQTLVQGDATAGKWRLNADRSIEGRDLCPDHARVYLQGIEATP